MHMHTHFASMLCYPIDDRALLALLPGAAPTHPAAGPAARQPQQAGPGMFCIFGIAISAGVCSELCLGVHREAHGHTGGIGAQIMACRSWHSDIWGRQGSVSKLGSALRGGVPELRRWALAGRSWVSEFRSWVSKFRSWISELWRPKLGFGGSELGFGVSEFRFVVSAHGG